MASMVAITSVAMTPEQKKALCIGVENGCAAAFDISVKICDLMLQTLAECDYGQNYDNAITFWVYTKPDKTDDQKRALVKNINDAVRAVVPDIAKVIVMVREHNADHPDSNVGVNGVLKLDM